MLVLLLFYTTDFLRVWCLDPSGAFFWGGALLFSTLLRAHLELGLIVSSHSMILSWFVCRSVVGFSLFFWWVGFFRLQTDPCVGSETIDGTIAPRIVTLDTGSWCFGLGFWRWVLLRFGCEIFFLHDCVAESLICRKKEIQHKACVSWKDRQRLGGVREPGFRVLNRALNGISVGKLVWACAAQTERDRDRGAEMASVLPSTTHDALYDNAKFRHRSSLRVSKSSKQHRGRLQTFQLMLMKSKR